MIKTLARLDLEDTRIKIEYVITCDVCETKNVDDFGIGGISDDADMYAINHHYKDKEHLR